MDRIRASFIVTLIVFAIVVWWLIEAFIKIPKAPTLNSQGIIVVDEYQRTKDILSVVFPLATAAVGYWLGSDGKSKAEDQAKSSQAQLTAVVGTSADSDLLEKAKSKYPEAFGK